MIGKFNSLECLEQGSGLAPNVEPDSFAVAPEFDCTEELRVEIDDTDETRPVRYTSDVRLILHTQAGGFRAELCYRIGYRITAHHRFRGRTGSGIHLQVGRNAQRHLTAIVTRLRFYSGLCFRTAYRCHKDDCHGAHCHCLCHCLFHFRSF